MGAFDVEVDGELFQEGVFKDLLLKEFGVLAAGAFFTRVFDEELGLGNGGGGEGVGLDDVAAGFIKALVDIADDVGFGEGEDVAVVEEVFFVVGKARTTGVLFFETVATNGRTHGSVEDHDAIGEGFLEFSGGVGLHE